MNIFQVLSQGKSRLHEPSMSAMLGYLLDSTRDHGLGDAFVRQFLTELDSERFGSILGMGFIKSQTYLEEPYEFQDTRRDVDIELLILDRNGDELHCIIIENKIKPGAANAAQLAEYYAAVTSSQPKLDALTFVFVTPASNNALLQAEFDGLKISNKRHAKYRLYWHSNGGGVVSMIREVLSQEASVKINPINDYIRHTLKAFVMHCVSAADAMQKKAMRVGEDIGEITDEVEIKTRSGRFRVVRRDSTQIQAFNLDEGEKAVARHVIAQYIDENKMGIAHGKYNTRMLGKKFFEQLESLARNRKKPTPARLAT